MTKSPSTERAYPEEMYAQLATLCRDRYHSALEEGKSEHAAFKEIVHIILDTYREALAS